MIAFFQEYLGMRNEYIDMSEFVRRIEENIYDPAEFEKALAWVKENCIEGADNNPPEIQTTREQKDQGLGDGCEDDDHCSRSDDR